MAEDLRTAYKRRFEEELAPERYEIFDLLDQLTPDRREFLKVLGGGLFFLVTVRAQERDVPVRVQVARGRYLSRGCGRSCDNSRAAMSGAGRRPDARPGDSFSPRGPLRDRRVAPAAVPVPRASPAAAS